MEDERKKDDKDEESGGAKPKTNKGKGKKSKGKNKGKNGKNKDKKAKRGKKKSKKTQSNAKEGEGSKDVGGKGGRSRRKGKRQASQVTDGDGPQVEELTTPPPRRSQRSKAMEPNSGAPSGEKKVKKTFGRRYRPSSEVGKKLWDALLNAFVAIISVQLHAPSKFEAGRFQEKPIQHTYGYL